MSNNDNNIEKRSFEAFVNAIGSEIEQAQVRLISAANAQMLFHYWKMGNYILYHQNRQGWGGKVIKKLAQAIRFNYPEKKGYSVRNLAYMCQFTRYYLLQVCKNHGQNPKSKQRIVYARSSCTNSRCSPNSNHRLPDAD